VAEHTNGTFGALLNATFGNAPELLISYAALRAGYYRVVQLTLLGSILTNLLFVFGVSCLVGGYKHSVQELRMTSGNVSIGMLFIATSGLLLPAALKMSNQEAFSSTTNNGGITATELHYSRLNSLFMILIYVGYLFFQLHTHKREFEDSPPPPSPTSSSIPGTPNSKSSPHRLRNIDIAKNRQAANADEELLLPQSTLYVPQCNESSNATDGMNNNNDNKSCSHSANLFCYGDTITTTTVVNQEKAHHHLMTFRAGILWLFIITLCISAMSDIIVDTIHSFAIKVNFSEVFTALVVVPFFSNIAEQTSSILFAYRNEMDLCVGITVGSAVQISLFVLPGSVLIGWMVGRSMSLFFHGFETASLLMGVLTVTAVLQGGTSNWLTGLFCIGVYGMIAVGFWFHQVEDLSVDEEISLRNETVKLLLRS
jgi:Ca2+:H+ antiporter